MQSGKATPFECSGGKPEVTSAGGLLSAFRGRETCLLGCNSTCALRGGKDAAAGGVRESCSRGLPRSSGPHRTAGITTRNSSPAFDGCCTAFTLGPPPPKQTANWPTRARPSWVAYSRRPPWMRKAIPYGAKLRPAMWVPSRIVRNSVAVSMPKPGGGVGRERRKKWCWGTEPSDPSGAPSLIPGLVFRWPAAAPKPSSARPGCGPRPRPPLGGRTHRGSRPDRLRAT